MKCIFCNIEKIKKDIVYETKNFYVKVGIGIITPGHIMIVPKQHYGCFGEMPDKYDLEFEKIKIPIAPRGGVFN